LTVARGAALKVDSFAELDIRCGLNNWELIVPGVIQEQDS
jgi:hypothetical protein